MVRQAVVIYATSPELEDLPMRYERAFTPSFLSALYRHVRRLSVAVGLCVLAGGTVATAQDLDDFRRAAAADGVEVIPFEGLRREAASIAKEVERAKTASRWKFGTFEKQKNNLLKEKAKKQEEIEDKQEEIEDLKDKHEDVDVSSLESDLKDLNDDLEDIDDKIEDLNKELEEGAKAWERLWNARGGLRELFDDAMDDVKRAQSNPKKYLGDDASDEDLKKLKTYLEVIEDEIELGEETHKDQEEGAKKTEEKFRDLIRKTEV